VNSRFRCAACREYKPATERQRAGKRWVCSDECRTVLYRNTPRLPFKRPEKKRVTRLNRDDPPKATRERVLARDRYTCRFDGAHTADHVHHINYRSQGVDHSEHNLISLCEQHHRLVHSSKRVWQPLLRAVIWYQYSRGISLTVLQVRRRLNR
jgi:5-methylcytosine-specific restriction endonuclease McrA